MPVLVAAEVADFLSEVELKLKLSDIIFAGGSPPVTTGDEGRGDTEIQLSRRYLESAASFNMKKRTNEDKAVMAGFKSIASKMVT